MLWRGNGRHAQGMPAISRPPATRAGAHRPRRFGLSPMRWCVSRWRGAACVPAVHREMPALPAVRPLLLDTANQKSGRHGIGPRGGLPPAKRHRFHWDWAWSAGCRTGDAGLPISVARAWAGEIGRGWHRRCARLLHETVGEPAPGPGLAALAIALARQLPSGTRRAPHDDG